MKLPFDIFVDTYYLLVFASRKGLKLFVLRMTPTLTL